MFTYGFVPFAIMLVCSIIIIHKLHSANNCDFKREDRNKNENSVVSLSVLKCESSSYKERNNRHKNKKQRHSMSKQMQVTSILLTTNILFVSLVSPLLIMNIFSLLQKESLATTIAYFLCYANHGYF